MIYTIYVLIIAVLRDDKREERSDGTDKLDRKISPVQYRAEATYFRTKMPGGAIPSHVGVNKTMF